MRAEARGGHAAHFGDDEARTHAAHLGMWLFLASEVLLFTVMFTAYALYRFDYGPMFHEGRKHMAVGLGTANTYILVSSSVLVALAVERGRSGHRLSCTLLLAGAFLLGAAFLVVKGIEYRQHIIEGALPGYRYRLDFPRGAGASIFFSLYWLMTGVHALHVVMGMSVLGALAVLAARGRFTPGHHSPLEIGGMYWHLVDVLWLFLWPLFYLV
jgi:cytochrome c oxidase subunit 3